MPRTTDYITIARQNCRQLWDALNNLEEMQKEWNALDYLNTLPEGTGANAGITAAIVGAAVFDAVTAIRTVMNAGSATNIAKML